MPDFKHGKICYILMPSQEPNRSSQFYSTVFNWTIRGDADDLSFDDATGQVSGRWITNRQPATEGNLELHIMVDDLDQTITTINASGGHVDPSERHHQGGGSWALFTDPDGNRLGIYQRQTN